MQGTVHQWTYRKQAHKTLAPPEGNNYKIRNTKYWEYMGWEDRTGRDRQGVPLPEGEGAGLSVMRKGHTDKTWASMSLLELPVGKSAPGKVLAQQVQNSSAGRILGASRPRGLLQLEWEGLGEVWESGTREALTLSEKERFAFHKNYIQNTSSTNSGD